MSSFDIDEPQILGHITSAAQPYVHIVLIRRVEGSRWLALKPSGLLEAVDVSAIQIITLIRATEFLATLVGHIEEFAVVPAIADMAMHHQRATVMLRLLSDGAVPATGTG